MTQPLTDAEIEGAQGIRQAALHPGAEGDEIVLLTAREVVTTLYPDATWLAGWEARGVADGDAVGALDTNAKLHYASQLNMQGQAENAIRALQPPSPIPPDPRDARIAELEARIAAALDVLPSTAEDPHERLPSWSIRLRDGVSAYDPRLPERN